MATEFEKRELLALPLAVQASTVITPGVSRVRAIGA